MNQIPDELDVYEMPINRAIGLWLAAGYCWEVEEFELIPDAVWHALCRRLDREYETLAHPLSHHLLIDRSGLAAGTCYYLKPNDFPPTARGLAQNLARAWHGRAIAYHVLPPGKWDAVQEPFW